MADSAATSAGSTSPGRIADAALGAFFFALYLALAQANLTFDGAAWLTFFTPLGHQGHAHHLLFGRVLHPFIAAAGWFGALPWTGGIVHSAFFMALAVVLFHRRLRALGVGAVALIYAALLGFNRPVLENATTVELYAPALTAVMLSLAAFTRAWRNPGRGSSALLFLSCVAVLGMHLGYSFWVLALYMALLPGRPGGIKGKLVWLIQGGATLAAILAWLWIEGLWNHGRAGETQRFFGDFFKVEGPGDVAIKLLRAPVIDFAANAGLILFPAAYGWGAFRREHPAEARLLLWSTFAFTAYYAFWVPEEGSFYLPLQSAWGMFAALGASQLLASAKPASRVILGLGVCGYYLLFIWGPPKITPPSPGLEAALGAVFIVAWILMAWIGARSARGETHAPSPFPAGTPAKGAAAAFGLAALAFSALSYLPESIESLRPDSTTLTCRAFTEVAPPGARWVTAIPRHRPLQQTGHESLAPFNDWSVPELNRTNLAILTGWIREAAREGGPPVYFDAAATRQREKIGGIWPDGARVDVPLEYLTFTLVESRRANFQVLGFASPAVRRAIAMEAEPYPAEDWGGRPVRWTRKKLYMELDKAGAFAQLNYWVGHEDVSAENPVVVRVFMNGAAAGEARHHAKGGGLFSLDLAGVAGGRFTLTLEASRDWLSPDGRRLGVAISPVEFSGAPGQ